MRRFAALTIILLALVLTACDAISSTPAQTPSPTPDASATAMISREATQQAIPPTSVPQPTATDASTAMLTDLNEAVRDTGDAKSGHLYIQTFLDIKPVATMEFDYQAGNGNGRIQLPSGSYMQFITIGSKEYDSLNNGQTWVDSTNPAFVNVVHQMVSEISASQLTFDTSDKVTKVGTENVGGFDTTHYKVVRSTGNTINMWIDSNSTAGGRFVRRIYLQTLDKSSGQNRYDITYSNFNVAMNIVAPNTAPPATDTPIAPIGKADVQVVQKVHYTDSIGSLYYIGLVTNNGSVPANNIKISITLMDASGGVVGTGDDILLSDVILGPDQSAPFKILVSNPPATWATDDATGTFDTYDPSQSSILPPATRLSVSNTTIAPSDIEGYVVRGIVHNADPNNAANLVSVIAWTTDDKGNIVDADNGYINGDLLAGSSAPFEVQLLRNAKTTKYFTIVTGYQK